MSLPIGLTGLDISLFTADVIGGAASLCPGLVPLKSLIALSCTILFSYFANGDGVLGIWDDKQRAWSAQRLYLTESGHYLLRIDHYNSRTDSELSAALQRTTAPLSRAADKMSQRQQAQQEPRELFCGVVQCSTDDSTTIDDPVFRAVPNRT